MEPKLIVYYTLANIIPVIAVPGGIILLIFSFRSGRNATSTDVLIGAIAILDIFKAIFYALISNTAYLYAEWTYGEAACQVILKSHAVFYFMSEFCIVLLTYMRYRVLKEDQPKPKIRKRVVLGFLTSVLCILMILAWTPKLYEWHVHEYEGTRVCELDQSPWIAAGAPSIILPAVFFIYVWYKIRHRLSLANATLQDMGEGIHIRNRIKSNRRAVLILGVIAFSFTLTWIPITIVHMIEALTTRSAESRVDHLLKWWVFLLFWISALDTWITFLAFATLHKSFRIFLRKYTCTISCTVCKKKEREKRESSQSTTNQRPTDIEHSTA